MTDKTLKSIQDNIEWLEQLRIHARSTKKVQPVSDDSTITIASNSLLSNIDDNKVYVDNAYSTENWLDINEMALSEIESLAKQALNLTLSDGSDVQDSTLLQDIKSEFESILNRTIDLANSQHNGDYIFAGTKTQIEPFLLDSPSNSVSYNGDDNEILRNISPSEQVIINFNGRTIFKNLFSSLIMGINALSLSELMALAGELQVSIDTINKMRKINEARQRQVLTAIKHGEEINFLLQTLDSQYEDVSIVEAITNLQQQEIAYQTVLEVANRTLSTIKLFDLT
jgi:flagellar hook-associated protein 3 FlgL